MSKSKANKTKSNKKNDRPQHVRPCQVAQIVGCTPQMVNLVWAGKRSNETKVGENIQVATCILEDGIQNAILKTKEIINKGI